MYVTLSIFQCLMSEHHRLRYNYSEPNIGTVSVDNKIKVSLLVFMSIEVCFVSMKNLETVSIHSGPQYQKKTVKTS